MVATYNTITSVDVIFFFNDTATTEIYTLSLHDALPICTRAAPAGRRRCWRTFSSIAPRSRRHGRSEEHTSELQSQSNLVCRLLLEKKNNVKLQRIPRHAERQ